MTWLDDARAAWRWMRTRPGACAVIVATLALSIGAATAVFTVVHAVLLRPMPARDPGRLVWMWNARVERDRAPFSIADLADYRSRNRTLSGLAPFTNWTGNLTGTGEAERLEGVRVAPHFFDVLGVTASRGRTMAPGDEREGRVVVLTDVFWRRRFSARADIVGQSISLNGAAHTVIGILPAGFLFPFRDAMLAVPLSLDADPRRADRGANFLRVVARLRDGVSIAAADEDLDAIGRRLAQEYPVEDGKKLGVSLFPLEREIAGGARPLLLTLGAAVLLLLAVSAANIANLLIVAMASRARELAVRVALGASRWRIGRQIAVEVCILVATGGLLGLAVSRSFVALLIATAGASLPPGLSAGISWPMLCSALVLTGGTALVCAMAPALHAASAAPHDALAAEGRSATMSVRRRLVTRAFVAAQVAASLVLLVVSVLSARNLVRLQQVDAGFDPAGVLSIQLSLPPARYGSPAALSTFVTRLQPALSGLPGVTHSAAISLAPLSGLLSAVDYRVVGRPEPRPEDVPQAHFRMATPDYFRTMGIAVIDGRAFTDFDGAATEPVAMVSATLAKRTWPDGHALGARILTGIEHQPRVIVGVVSDVKQFTLDAPATADLYVPVPQMPASQAGLVAARMFWFLKTRDDSSERPARVRAEVSAIDPEIASSSVKPMDEVIGVSLAPQRLTTRLMTVFVQASLAIAVIGVYGITAFAVRRRRREIGIRLVFGATPGQIVGLILGDAAVAIVAGVAAGAVAAALAGRVMSRTLFAAPSFDLPVLGAASAIVAIVAIGACLLSAWRGLTQPAMRSWDQP